MALIGTISGSVGTGGVLTSATAVSGTLIISDSPAGSFPALPAGAKLFVAGNISGSNDFRVTGNITGSNMLLTSGFIVTGSGIIESNTSIAALRVIQIGSGDSILVEDSTNPDSSPFVVTAAGRVGIGTTAPTANLFVTGTDTTIPAFVVKGSDSAVNTFSVTSSAGANTATGLVSIDQGNVSNKYALTIKNVGAGTAGFKVTANSTGVGLALDNITTTPQFTLTHKNLWFESTSTAYDTSQITYKFIEDNKTPTYTNQKTFLISGNNNGHKTGSYFEVQHSGTVGNQIILQLQGDAANNALFVSGTIFVTGSAFINGNLAVTGGNITTTATTFNLVNTTATTVNFAGGASNLLKIGNSAAKNEFSGSTSFPQGISGSLTRLTDGTSYIIQGSGILVTSASNGAITLSGGGGSSPINVYTTTAGSPFTLAIPAHSTTIEIEACGAGGGGGSGRKGPAANGVYGGGGGSGGAYSSVVLNAATARAISANLTITIGAGGTGGAAQTADSNNGNPGNPGNNISVAAGGTTLLVAPGGSSGQAGTTTNGLGGIGTSWYLTGGSGGGSSNTTAPNQPTLAGFAGGGGAGGGVTTVGTALNGGNGGHGGDLRVDNVSRTGAGGNAATPRNGTDATVTATYSPTGGGGGGGGAGRNGGGGAAGGGGNGIQGSGGGGGGGNIDGAGNDSGKGGDGAAGWCVVRFA